MKIPSWLEWSRVTRVVERFLTDDYALQRDALEFVPDSPKMVLDIGCGGAVYLDDLEAGCKIGVDANAKRLKEARRHCDEVIQADVRHLDYGRIPADVVLCFEVIEHLSYKDGYDLLDELKGFPCVVLTTPREDIEVKRDGWERHQSFWSEDKLAGYGYERVGQAHVPPSNIYVYNKQAATA